MKKTLCFLLAIISAFLLSVTCLAFDSAEADALNSLGLFNGTDKGYELDAQATRVQIAVTFTRLLGKEQKAVAQNNAHPFTDVPSWASDCIGWLYESYLVNGVSDNSFGSQSTASPKQFVTMCLRSLGYSDSGENLDFTYDTSLDFAKNVGLLNAEDYGKYTGNNVLLRGDMVHLSYLTLRANLKDARKTLAEKLCYEQKVFTEESGVSAKVMDAYSPEKFFDGINVNLGKMTINLSGNMAIVTMQKQVETYGLRLYISVDGGYYYEIPSTSVQSKTFWFMTDTHYEGAAQMMNSFQVSGLPSFENSISFVLAKTTSTSNMFSYSGRTESVTILKSEVSA